MSEEQNEEGLATLPVAPLNGRQKRHLRGLAHHLNVTVQVGKEGVTDGVIVATRAALEEHELIKVRVMEGSPTSRKESAPVLASSSGAHLVGQVGRVVILYRRRKKNPDIRIPRSA